MGQFDPKESEPNNSVPSVSSPSTMPVKYGEIVVLGYNGYLPQGDKGRRRSKFVLNRREKPNGIKRSKHYVVEEPSNSKAILDANLHSISYTLSRNQAIIVEYISDNDTDMFQIGRSSELPIDFVVMDTIAGDKSADKIAINNTASTISRFACRILIERKPPYIARVFAAGFDSARNIFLGEKATKWQEDNLIDGLTTNGVLLLHTKGGFVNGNGKPNAWREVSVNGGMYTMRESRSAPQKGVKVQSESNILMDGSMIDLCGVTLLWRSAEGLEKSPTRRELESMLDLINSGKPQCPVGLNTLVVGRKTNSIERQPYVYLKCGHVQGFHEWGLKSNFTKTCPICLEVGPFVALDMSYECSGYTDNGPLTYCFSPCGHMASEQTAKFWSLIPIPKGTKGFESECPFCACPLEGETGYVRLIFQDNVD